MHSIFRARPSAAIVVAVVLIAGGITAGLQWRAASVDAEAEREARSELSDELDRSRRDLAMPAEDAHRAAGELRVNLADAVRGSDRPADEIAEEREQLLERLRENARALDTARVPAVDGGGVLPVSEVDAPVERLQRLHEQAGIVASEVRDAADEAEAWAQAAHRLNDAAEEFLSADLPGTDDPEALAQRWRADAEMLADYREAAEAAAEQDALEEVGTAHLRLVDGLEELAGEATALLEDGEVDAYNDLLAEQLGGDDPYGFQAALDDAVRAAVTEGPIGEVEDARDRALHLLTRLDGLRDVGRLGATAA